MLRFRAPDRMAWLLPIVIVPVCAQAPRARDLYYEKETPAAAVVPVAQHLGVRYNLLKVDPPTRAVQAADPDGNFKEGDCFALDFVPNRDGQLYIFNLGSSGEWQLLLPSPSMPGEIRMVKAGATVRVPQQFCFALDARKGVETMLVAVTNDQKDMDRFSSEMRASILKPGAPSPAETTVVTKLVRDEVTKWQQQQLTGRDIFVEKVSAAESAGEMPYSVYVVQNSSAESSHFVVEIKIRHE